MKNKLSEKFRVEIKAAETQHTISQNKYNESKGALFKGKLGILKKHLEEIEEMEKLIDAQQIVNKKLRANLENAEKHIWWYVHGKCQVQPTHKE